MPHRQQDRDNPGWITVRGHPPHLGPHTVDVQAHMGQVLLKLTLNGRNPGGGTPEIDLMLTEPQARTLLKTLVNAMHSVGYAVDV